MVIGQIAREREVKTMRTRLQVLALALAIALLVALPNSAASALATKTAPPITSLQVCTTYPVQIVAKELGKHTQPVASPGYSSKLTSVDFAVYCSYRFSASSLLNIVFYGPAHPPVETAGSRVPALGATGRLVVSPPRMFIDWLSRGYDITVGGQSAAFSRSSLVTLALYITQHLP